MFTGKAREHSIRVTLFGGNLAPSKSWVYLGWYDFSGGSPMMAVARVPAGKTFKLWALGKGDGEWLGTDIRAYDETRGVTIHALGLGIDFDSYPTPYTAQGECIVNLQGYNDSLTEQPVSGLMVFSIE